MSRRLPASLLGALVAAALIAPAASAAAPAATYAAGRYLVVLRPGVSVDATASEHSARHGASVRHRYRYALNGYAATLSSDAAAELAADPRVAFLERDGVFRATTTQNNPVWGLDRIDQRALPLSATYSYTSKGLGVKAYVIDTGVRMSHNDFGGRAVNGFDAVDGGAASDCNGHGTHVAGTLGGTKFGVAKKVTIVAVRVLDCDGRGTTADVVAGVDWVTGNHGANQPAVANMSLGGSPSPALDQALKNSIDDRITYAVAAGNGNVLGQAVDACNVSPARVKPAITVSATDASDTKPVWANKGSCVDWFAPGVGIKSAYNTGNNATAVISGTSMSSPHTAGVAALYLQTHPGAQPQGVRLALFSLTTKDVVRNSATANDHLLFTNL